MSKARNISNLFSSATDLATDAEVTAAIAAKANLSGGNTFSGVQTLESASEWPLISRFTNSTPTHRNHLLMQRSNNNTAVTSGFNLGGIAVSGHDGTSYGLGWNGGAEITAFASQTWTPSARGTDLVIYTSYANTTSPSERFRIAANDTFGFNVATPSYGIHHRVFGNAEIATQYGTGLATYIGAYAAEGSLRVTGSNPLTFYTNSTERMRIDSSGNIGVNNSSPVSYNTSGGRVVNITGTSLNSGPSTIMQIGNSGTQGAGYAATEVFAIANITSAQEITRVTGTNANGFRAYFKIIVTGHTGTIGNGTNIKEFYWDGGTNAPVQISTYTANNVPPITFDTTVSNRLVVLLASSNGSAGFNGVMKVEWMLPIDFASSTYTLS